MTETLESVLANRAYPGRVCIAAVTLDGIPVFGYALTGRSTASRARALRTLPDDDIEVSDASGGPRDELRHYTALARRGGWLVVGNGDQVVPIAESLAAGRSEREAWRQHTFEPDPPIWTPRIWAVKHQSSDEVVLGWARRGSDGSTQRGLVAVSGIEPGHGLLMSTYQGTTTEVLTSGQPVEVAIDHHDHHGLGDALWAALAHDLRVAAFTVTSNETRLLPADDSV